MDGNLARELDRADQEIDKFIEKRAAEREKINAEATAWRASERHYDRLKREAYRSEWMTYFLHLAETHDELAERAREKAWSLDA